MDCEARLVRLPGHHGQQIRRLATITQQHLQRHGTEPSLLDLAAAAGMPVERVRALLEEARGIVSLDQPVEDDASLGDMVAASDGPAPDDSPERQQLLEHLKSLDPLARDVVSALWGLHGEPLGPTATAQLVGLPGPRAVREVERQALRPLGQQTRAPIVAPAKPEPFAHRLGAQIGLPLD